MTTTDLIQAPRAADPPSVAARGASPSPTVREMVAEVLPLVETPPAYGPAVVLLAVPWLFVVLMLVGPFVLLFTLVLALVVAAAVVALIAAILAAPFLLVRRLRSARADRAASRAPAAPLVARESRLGVA